MTATNKEATGRPQSRQEVEAELRHEQTSRALGAISNNDPAMARTIFEALAGSPNPDHRLAAANMISTVIIPRKQFGLEPGYSWGTDPATQIEGIIPHEIDPVLQRLLDDTDSRVSSVASLNQTSELDQTYDMEEARLELEVEVGEKCLLAQSSSNLESSNLSLN